MKHGRGTRRVIRLLCGVLLTAALLAAGAVSAWAAPMVWVWLKEQDKEPVTDYAYSFVAVGDTQIVCERHPEQMADLYDWIVEHVESKKIAYVFGLGDITNSSTVAEWTVAKREIGKLNGVVPYSIIRGNHDKKAGYHNTFAKDAYLAQFEGFYQEGKADNTWRTFSVAGVDYLFVTLDYGASDDILNWAGEAIAAHPHHRVIISTHAYMHRNGVRLSPAVTTVTPNPNNLQDGSVNHGQQMWDKLFSKYENIFMILSGHISTENVEMSTAQGDHGNTVYQFLIDPQGVDATIGATGIIAILYFSEDGRTVTVEQFSTVREQYYRSSSQFSFEIPAYDAHTFTNYVSDDNATCIAHGTKTAVCDGCAVTHTVEDDGALAPHSYADGVCVVCGAAQPAETSAQVSTETAAEPSSPPVGGDDTAAPDAGSGNIAATVWTAALPAVVFAAAVAVGYVLAKSRKR